LNLCEHYLEVRIQAMRLLHILVSFDAFMAVMFLVFVFWVVIPHSVVVEYQHFGGLHCLHRTTTLHSVTTQKTLT